MTETASDMTQGPAPSRTRARWALLAVATAAASVAVVACMPLIGQGADAAAPAAAAAGAGGPTRPVARPAPTVATEPVRSARVASVGDSLLYNLDADISAHTDLAVRPAGEFTGGLTAAGYDPVLVSGNPGFATSQLLGAVDDAVALHPDTVVFVSGSNEAVDIVYGQPETPDHDAMVRAIRDALDAMSDVECVVWPTVTTQANIPMYWGERTDAPQAVNDALRAEAARRPNLHLVEWDTASAGHLPGSPDPWFLADGLHHTAAGEDAFQAEILAAVAGCTD